MAMHPNYHLHLFLAKTVQLWTRIRILCNRLRKIINRSIKILIKPLKSAKMTPEFS